MPRTSPLPNSDLPARKRAIRFLYRHEGSFLVFILLPLVLQAEEPVKVAAFRADATPTLGSPLCNEGVKPATKIIQPLEAIGLIIVLPRSFW